jgi:PKD repeat protein
MIHGKVKGDLIILAIGLLLIIPTISIIPTVSASISSTSGDGWADVETAWFAKTRHGGAGGFRASVGIDPTSSEGQDGWFAGGWTWISGSSYHFRLEYDVTTETAELYVDGQNNDNALCTYEVGSSLGRIGINARTAPDIGKSTIIENIQFNGADIWPENSVTATSLSGESAVRHLLIEGADLQTDFTLEGDFIFEYETSTHDECPSMVINVENSDDRLCTIHFVTPLRGLDGDLSVWSTGDNLVNLGTDTWSLLDGNASVTGYTRDKLSNTLTQRGTRGLGLNGQENDEVDSHDRPEVIDVNFSKPYIVDYIEVRSLFDEWWGTEEGEIELWYEGENFEIIHIVGVEELDGSNIGKLGVEIDPPRMIDRLVFWVPPDQPYTDESDFAVAKINLTELEPPIANAQGLYSGIDNEIITLNASASYDPDGTIVNYEWILNGTTIYDGTNPTKDLNLNGMVGGSYDLSLIVTDNDGLNDTDSTTLIVYNLPIAEANGAYSGTTIESITLDATGSYDLDGTITNYEWIIDGFSICNTSDLSYDLDLVSYEMGTYDVELIVTDDDGYIDNDTTFVTVNNEIPVADAGDHYHAYYEEEYFVEFDGSGSYDVDGEIISYEWDFGDGTTGHGMNPSHYYERPNSLEVSLTVTDNNGATDTDTQIITFHGKNEFAPIIQLIYPTGGEILTEDEMVRWYAIDDDLRGEDLPIDLFYSVNGINWVKINNEPLCNNIDIEHGSYEWNTKRLSDGSYYLMGRVTGTGGFDRDSTKKFAIDNKNAGILIPDVIIEDLTTGSITCIRDEDTISITASITGHDASMLTEDQIKADLSCLGGESEVSPRSFNGFLANWIIDDITCSIDSGEISIPILIDGKVKSEGTIIVDNIPPEIVLHKPKNGVYIKGLRLFPFGHTIIFGGLPVEIDVIDNIEVNYVEYYVDGTLLSTIDKEPFSWYMNIRTFNAEHQLTVNVFDYAGNFVSQEVTFRMFNYNGDIW